MFKVGLHFFPLHDKVILCLFCFFLVMDVIIIIIRAVKLDCGIFRPSAGNALIN